MIHSDVLALIGETPIVRFNQVSKGLRGTVAGKLELLNPGGSSKDRIALRMIEEAEASGQLRPGGTIIESTSGNTGAGLALVAAIKGYHCIFVMTDKVSDEKVAFLRAYGAQVVLVAADSPENQYEVAERLAREVHGAFQPNQYFNSANPQTHYCTTGPEIWRQTEGQITHLVAGAGTGGTISGTARYLKEQNPAIKVIAADPEGSIFSGTGDLYASKVEGIGKDFWPGVFDSSLVDEFVQVSDRDSLLTARRVTRTEGLLLGGSGGTAVCAALQVAQRDDHDDMLIVVIVPDSGRSYLSKIYNDAWMHENDFLTPVIHSPRRLVCTDEELIAASDD